MTATTLTAKFTDANANAPTSDFSGTINWGDGAPGSPDITTFTSSAVTGSAGSYFSERQPSIRRGWHVPDHCGHQ